MNAQVARLAWAFKTLNLFLFFMNLFRYTFCLFLCLLLGESDLLAQTIKGKVLNVSENNEPLSFAPVSLRNLADEIIETVTTNDNGEYVFENVKPGSYNIRVEAMGYDEMEKPLRLAANENKTLDFNIGEKAEVMDVVVITGDRSETKLSRSAISIDVVSPDLADNNAINRADDALVKVPGVTVVDGQANIRGGSGYSFGAGSRVLLLVDDLPFLAADADFPNWRDIPIENIDQMEVLKGAGSALYGSSALNGIINIRTAFAKSGRPISKVALYHTSFDKPKREGLDWWNRESIVSYDGTDTITPSWFSGRAGYRKPQELGLLFAHRRKIKRFSLTLGGQYFYQDAYLAGQYERKFRINANTMYQLTDKLNIGINGNFNTGRSGSFFLWGNTNFLTIVDTAVLTPLSGTVTETNTTRINIDPYLTYYALDGARHRIQTRIYYVDNQNLNNQSNQSTLYYGEYQYQRKFENLNNLNIVAGAVGQYATVNAELYGNAQYQMSNSAAYVQSSVGFFRKKDVVTPDYRLILSFGARAEFNTVNGPDSVLVDPLRPVVFNPNSRDREARPVFRAGLNYEAAPYTFVRASWGQGYRYPTIAERYITTFIGEPGSIQSLAIFANPSLQSETGWSAELGIKQGIRLGGKDKNPWMGFIDLAGFWTEYQNMMEFTFGGGDPNARPSSGIGFFQSINTGNTMIRGFEGSIMGQGRIAGIKTNILTGYTFLDPRFKDFDTLQRILSSSDENILKFRNVHTAKFDVESFFLKEENLSFGVAVLYASAMEAVDRFFEDIDLRGIRIEDGLATRNGRPFDFFGIGRYRQEFNDGRYFDLQARVSYRHTLRRDSKGKALETVKFSVVGRNLLNQEYTIRPALIAPQRHFTLRLDFDF